MSVAIQPKNRYALKEWAVVVEALSSGRQTLLLRKGGIMEDKGEFTVEHTEFFLYPTYVHEQAERILPEAAKDLEAILETKPPDDRVIFNTYSAVEEAIAVDDLKRIEKLRPYHILSAQEVENRFQYRNRPGLHVLLLRIYRMPEPVELAVTSAYAGCKSWVDLEMELSTAGCRPVLNDDSFHHQIQTIRSILKLDHTL